MKSRPWFHATFIFWCLLGTAGLARALWWGPRVLPRKAGGSFSYVIDGTPARATAWTTQTANVEAVGLLEEEWTQEGWELLDAPVDPIALWFFPAEGQGEERDLLRSMVQVRVYRRKGAVRLLGLRRDAEGTLGVLCLDLPAPSRAEAKGSPRSPLLEPPSVKERLDLRVGGFECLCWRLPRVSDPDRWFRDWAGRQGASLRPWSGDPRGRCYRVRWRGRRFLARIEDGARETTCQWVSLP